MPHRQRYGLFTHPITTTGWAAAAILVTTATVGMSHRPTPIVVIAAAAILFFLSFAYPLPGILRTPRGGRYTLSGVVCVVSIAVSHPEWVVVACAAAGVASVAARLTPGGRPDTADSQVRNASAEVLACTATVGVLTWAPAPNPYTTTVYAFVAAAVVHDLVLSAAYWLGAGSQTQPNRSPRRFAETAARLLIPFAVGSVGWSVSRIPTDEIRAAVLAIPALLAAVVAVGLWARTANASRKAFAIMDRAAADMVLLRTEPEIIGYALRAVRDAFHADRVTAELVTDSGCVWYLDQGAASPTQVPLPAGRDVTDVSAPCADPSVPLLSNGVLIGRVNVYPREGKQGEGSYPSVLLAALCRTLSGAVVSARTVAELEQRRVEAQQLALTDAVTGMPNRWALAERAEQVMAGGGASLAVLDIDRFKRVNDTLGHVTGDEMIRVVGSRITNIVTEHGQGAFAARLGGDEFAILIPAGVDPVPLVERVLEGAAEPVLVDGMSVSSESSAGVAYTADGWGFSDLLRAADTAMYQAKRDGRGWWAAYDPALDDNEVVSLVLGTDLREGLTEDQFALHYQPQVSAHDGRLVGVEALARWEHPKMGLLHPAKFLDLVECSGTIVPFTHALLEQAIRDRMGVLERVGDEVTVSVNVSGKVIADADLPDVIEDLLGRYGMPARLLIVEVTETVQPSSPQAAGRSLARLSSMGVRVAVDDFGTGYSSLTALTRSPVDELKIDRSFVRAALTDPAAAAIVRAAVDLGSGMNCRVVAEGVEDAQVAAEMTRLGCDVLQGWWVGKPMPAAELVGWEAARTVTGG